MISQDALLDNADKIFDECMSILEHKNRDYSGNNDAYDNFRLCEELNITTTERGILVRLADKFKRLCNSENKELVVDDETIKDTVLDMINYLVIYLTYKQNK